MDSNQFVKAIDDADLEALMGQDEEKVNDFLVFIKENIDEGSDNVVLRCSLEEDVPYYVWVVYSVISNDDSVGIRIKEIYIPKEEDFHSYYRTPQNLEGRRFFDIVVDD